MNLIGQLMRRIRPLVRLRRRLLGPLRPTWPEEFETIATVLRTSADVSVLLPLSIQRYAVDGPRPDSDIVKETTIVSVRAGGVPGHWFSRPESHSDRVIIYLHGGGYSVGSVRSHRDLIARLCKSSGARVLALDYRLAPEYPFPAQLDDALVAYRWLLGQGIHPARVAIAGESAGAGLTLSTLIRLRELGEPLPATAVLISPWVDLEARGASFHENRGFDFVTRAAIEAYTRRFVRRHERRHPLAAPIHARLHGLPPLLIQVGEVEALRDDGVSLAALVEAAGGKVKLEIWDDMIHAFHVFAPMLPAARDAIDRIAAHISEHLDEAEEQAGRARPSGGG
jgi:epsilon-lactone hydrolase